MRLLDHFIPIFTYTLHLLHDPRDSSLTYAHVDESMTRLLDEAQKSCGAAGIADREYRLAHFAICAWVDDVILNSDWLGKEQWEFQTLQGRFYNTREAGAIFFEKLGAITETEKQVLEVYYYCLALGFKGQLYRPESRDRLKTLTDNSLRSLTKLADKTFCSRLFPEAYRGVNDQVPGIKRRIPRAWLLFAAPVITVFVIYLILHVILNSTVLGYL